MTACVEYFRWTNRIAQTALDAMLCYGYGLVMDINGINGTYLLTPTTHLSTAGSTLQTTIGIGPRQLLIIGRIIELILSIIATKAAHQRIQGI